MTADGVGESIDISVVIVSYRVKYFLEQTLLSVREALKGLRGEVFVVDNDQCDYSLSFLRERFPEVQFIVNEQNEGFARANNRAIARARGRYTLILNPDTIITHKCLAEPLEWMRTHSRCGAIGAHMIDGNGVFLPESKRAFPTPWVSFCKIFGLSSLMPRSRWFARYHLRYLDEREAHRIDILAGAYMFCRTSLLKNVGGFDEDFFMYGEDIDLSYRMAKAGYDNWYLPVDMVHYKGESTKKDSMRYVRVFYDAMLIFYRKHFPGYSALLYPLVKAGVGVRAGMARLRRLLRPNANARSNADTSRGQWVVLAANAPAVAAKCGIARYATTMPAGGAANVLIDNASHSYGEIVELIARYSRPGISFHIYSAQNDIVISPKMQQS